MICVYNGKRYDKLDPWEFCFVSCRLFHTIGTKKSALFR